MSIKAIPTKVCIIGASLEGLLIANILRKNNISCVLIEKYSYPEVYARSKAGLVDHKTVNILQKYGLSDRLVREGIPQGKCEFRTLEQSFVLDYAKTCRGQVHYAYPQQELLADLIKKFKQTGGELLFNTEATAVTNSNHGARIKCQQNSINLITISCDFIGGCDGFEGVSRAAIPEMVVKPRHKSFNYSWLVLTVQGSSFAKHTIYGLHPHGFAGHMLQDEEMSRYYLQIPVKDTAADWSDSRIWSELQTRLAKDDERLTKGEIIDKKVLQIESITAQTMQHCRLFLAGNSAHIIPPAGDKALSTAIQDAEVLSKAFISYYRYQDNLPLKNYSKNRLPAIRQTQQFAESLLHMINVQNNHTLAGNAQQRVQQFKRSQLMNSEIYALDFARKYVGYVKSDIAKKKLAIPQKSLNMPEFDLAQLPPLQVG